MSIGRVSSINFEPSEGFHSCNPAFEDEEHGNTERDVPGSSADRFPFPHLTKEEAHECKAIVISEAERNIYAADFDEIDKDGSGFIEEEEIGALIRKQLEREPTEAEVKSLLNRFDRDQDGMISFEEYMIMVLGENWRLEGHTTATDSGSHQEKPDAAANNPPPNLYRPGKVNKLFTKLQEECMASLDPYALKELKNLKDPPEAVKQIFLMILHLLGQESTDWKHARTHLMHSKELLRRLGHLPEVVVQGHAPIENFEEARMVLRKIGKNTQGGLSAWPGLVKKQSAAAECLAHYIIHVVDLYDVLYLRPALVKSGDYPLKPHREYYFFFDENETWNHVAKREGASVVVKVGGDGSHRVSTGKTGVKLKIPDECNTTKEVLMLLNTKFPEWPAEDDTWEL